MNIGKDNRHPKYICDKCKNAIPYEYQKGILVNKYYKQDKLSYINYKDFDLCERCEKKFREWLSKEEYGDIISKFPIWRSRL